MTKDCIEWTKGTDAKGYGVQRYRGKFQRSHRVAFFEAHGYWPNICRHTCDNPPCINPEHLLDGTRGDNIRDAVERGRYVSANGRKTHCKHGHEFTPENTIIRTKPPGRDCRACQRARWAARKKD